MGLRFVDVKTGVANIQERFDRRRRRVRLQHQQMRLGACDKVKIWGRPWPKRNLNLPMETTTLSMLFQELEESEFISMQDLSERESSAIQRFETSGLIYDSF